MAKSSPSSLRTSLSPPPPPSCQCSVAMTQTVRTSRGKVPAAGKPCPPPPPFCDSAPRPARGFCRVARHISLIARRLLRTACCTSRYLCSLFLACVQVPHRDTLEGLRYGSLRRGVDRAVPAKLCHRFAAFSSLLRPLPPPPRSRYQRIIPPLSLCPSLWSLFVPVELSSRQ